MVRASTILPVARDSGDQKLLDDVRDHGWHVVKVLETDKSPGWAFSIGLFHNYSQPEIVVAGLALDSMHHIVNIVGEMARDGTSLEAGMTSLDVLEDYACTFEAVASAWYRPLLGYANWFYGSSPFPALQCQLPDRDNHFPGDPTFDPELAVWQPALQHSDAGRAGMVPLLTALGASK